MMIIVDDAKKESSKIDQRWVGRNNIRPCPNIIAANIRKQQKHNFDQIGLFVCVGNDMELDLFGMLAAS